MPPLPPYQIQYHPQDHHLPPWHSHPYILPLVTIPQEESPPLRRCWRCSNIWRRRVNNTYVRPGHYHPYALPQQRRYSYVEDGNFGYSELEDVEPQYYYISGEADVDTEIEFGTDFDLTLYGCTPGAEAEVGITYLPPVDAPDDDDAEVEDCPICLDEMHPEDRFNPTAELPCGHPFHADCIMKWLCDGDHNTCPICRYELPPDE